MSIPSPNLKPVSRVTLGEQVASQLADRIAQGIWRPGDKLPSEAELCATLHIGRSTLREALKSDRILTRGLLTTEKELADIAEARLILETELAALAAERAEPSDLRKLDGLLHDMKRSLDADDGSYAALDVDFHLAIAMCSKNRILHELLVPIRGVLQEFIAKSQEMPGIKQSAHKHHAKILATLRGRNPEKARRAMRAHLQTCEKAFSLLGKISETTESAVRRNVRVRRTA